MTSSLILAHGVGSVYKLPLPLPLYLGAAAATVVVSFALRALLPERRTEVDRRIVGPSGTSAIAGTLRVVAVFFLLLAILSGAIVRERGLTLAPLAFWVGLVVGVTVLSVIFGGIWKHIDPWAAAERTYRIKGVEAEPRTFPWWVGPLGVYLLFWFELVSGVGFESFWIVLVLVGYSLFVFTFRASLGDQWEEVDPFSILFGFASRTSPLRVEDDGIYLRGWLGGLDDPKPMPPALYASVFFLLASTTLDNVKETVGWTSFLSGTGLDALPDMLLNSLALALFAVPFFALFMLATWGAHHWTGRRVPMMLLGRHLGWSLIPIGVAYVLAHNAPLVMTGAPQLLQALSDPFQRGWNLLGTAGMFSGFLPSPKLVWFLEIGLIVAGHILGVVAAHRSVVRLAEDHRAAVRAELPLTLLMATFTITTLWLLAQPLVT
ncbi:MAG: hypothetical protein QOH26_1865 [Actinomycetota bacterium]|nr:hypothetical protein [Actinomycetota bacterium]